MPEGGTGAPPTHWGGIGWVGTGIGGMEGGGGVGGAMHWLTRSRS